MKEQLRFLKTARYGMDYYKSWNTINPKDFVDANNKLRYIFLCVQYALHVY